MSGFLALKSSMCKKLVLSPAAQSFANTGIPCSSRSSCTCAGQAAASPPETEEGWWKVKIPGEVPAVNTYTVTYPHPARRQPGECN